MKRTAALPLAASEPGVLLRAILAGELLFALLLQAHGWLPPVASRAFQFFLRF
ncbi:MAG: hypothetical protein ABI592_03290 [Acidobacteriota bacterium]